MQKSKCNKDLYKSFLQASSVRYSGKALSEVSPKNLSHDSASRWLNNSNFRPNEVYKESSKYIDHDAPCLLLGDDTVLSKQYSKKIDLVNYQYSVAVHDVIAGIGMLNLLHYNSINDQSVPLDYRIYDKDTDGKTKNDHFCEILTLAKERGFRPDAVVMDAWYSSLGNLKHIRNLGWTWVTNLRKNRKVNHNVSLESLEIPDEGLKIHLRGYGWFTLFKFVAKNGRIDYITTNLENPTRQQVERIVKAGWSIEVYHRELKQTCGIERCQARTGRAQRNHICLAVFAWLEMNKRRINEKITLYQQTWEVIKTSIQDKLRWLLADAQFS